MSRTPDPKLTPAQQSDAREAAELLLSNYQPDIEHHEIVTTLQRDFAMSSGDADRVALHVGYLTRSATAVWTLPEDDPDSRCGASTKTATDRTWCWNTDVPHTHHHNAYGFTWTD